MHKAKLINPITYMMETNPNSAAAAAPDPSRSAPPAAAAESDTVLTRDIDGTSSSRSNIMSEEKMIAAKERFHELLEKILSDEE